MEVALCHEPSELPSDHSHFVGNVEVFSPASAVVWLAGSVYELEGSDCSVHIRFHDVIVDCSL